MQTWLTTKALAVILAAIIGPLTFFASHLILNAWRSIDRMPASVKRFVVLVVAMAIAAGAQAAGITLPGECEGLGAGGLDPECQNALAAPAFLKGVLGALVAYLMHWFRKSDPRAPLVPSESLVGSSRK